MVQSTPFSVNAAILHDMYSFACKRSKTGGNSVISHPPSGVWGRNAIQGPPSTSVPGEAASRYLATVATVWFLAINAAQQPAPTPACSLAAKPCSGPFRCTVPSYAAWTKRLLCAARGDCADSPPHPSAQTHAAVQAQPHRLPPGRERQARILWLPLYPGLPWSDMFCKLPQAQHMRCPARLQCSASA